MTELGKVIARNLTAVVALGAYRIPLRAASACGLGSLKMANKSQKTLTVDVKVNVANCLWAISWLILIVFA